MEKSYFKLILVHETPLQLKFKMTEQARYVNFEMSFWCLQIDQKTNKIVRISALASKKRSNQNTLYH